MKTAHSEDNADKNITGSTRQHIISRLNKAAESSKIIVNLLSDQAASKASDIDLLEAKAYTYSLLGAKEFEKQAEGVKSGGASSERWLSCLTNYSAARIIYSALSKATKRDLYKDVASSTTDPGIRYAAYQHKIPRTVGVSAVSKKFFPRDQADLVQAVEKLDSAALQDEDASSQGMTRMIFGEDTC